MLRLDLNRAEDPARPRSRIESVYEWIAGNDDYQRNDNNLRMIQFCVITVSALGTGFVNAFTHRERLGWIGAALLAALITGFVEKFYFTLRHGLLTIYKSRKQRLAARLCYRVIQATMILNATILCAWVAGIALPVFLQFWNRWSISVHFGLALIGVSAVRDYDAV
ncbi:MAG TPA: hypothetical protein VFY40_06685, partial [Blastocatellia bacterium]|nr:hypothetical protein [Blastocatellia bacterium]